MTSGPPSTDTPMTSQKQSTNDDPRVPEVLDRLPEDLREIYIEAISFKGPVPPPSMFAAYEKVLTGSADHLLTLTENEQHNRFELIKRAQIFSSISSLVSIIGAVIIAIFGPPIVAGLLGSAGLVAGIASLIASLLGKDE